MPEAGTADHVANLLREGDKDRFLSDLFVPPDRRLHVMSVHAFALEVSRIRELVSEPMPGEIRLQWWRDAVEGERRGEVAQHPLAALVIETIERFALPRQPFLDLIEARSFDLYNDPMGSLAELEGYGAATAGAPMALAARILGEGAGEQPEASTQSGGVAYAIAGLLRAIPMHASRGQIYMPLDVLERHGADPAVFLKGEADEHVRAALKEIVALARSHHALAVEAARRAPKDIFPALLPLALVPAYLDRFEAAGFDPFSAKVFLPQWRRQWILWRTARRGFG